METRNHTVRDLRKANRQKVLQIAYFNAPITRLELSQLSGLSPATVTNVITDLLAEKLLTEFGSKESAGGRPRAILRINAHYGYFVGVEVGETDIHVELLDFCFTKIAEMHHFLTANENQPFYVGDRIIESIETLLTQAQITDAQILGVGVGVPGIIDRQSGVSIFAANWEWHHVDLLNMLQSRLNMPVYLDNEAQTMALAEKWFGAGAAQSVENLAVLLIATGIGAGFITQGQLYQGSSNSAGEWGHTCIQVDGPECSCGSRGCLEAFVGAPGIIRRLRELDPHSPLLTIERQVDTITAIRDASREGDPIATHLLDQTAHYLGIGIANIINLFNPQVITLGGWSILLLGEQFLKRLYPYIERYAMQRAFCATKIHLSTLQHDAISIGAASLALEEFLNRQLA